MTSRLVVVVLLGVAVCFGQQPPIVKNPGSTAREMNEPLLQAPKPSLDSAQPQEYRIGPEDLLDISVFEVPEMSRTVRVSASGEISLPLLGQVQAAGLTALQLERSLTEKLQQTYIKDPQVSVFLKEFKSDPVSIVGAVQAPGPYYIQLPKSLLEMLAMAHGLPDAPRGPGRFILVSRGRRAMSQVPAGGGSAPEPQTLEIPVAELLKAGGERWNVTIYPGDVIKVTPAAQVYVAGDVNRPGAFTLTGLDSISLIQALALAGGTIKSAKLSDSVIIHNDDKGNRTEQKVDLKRVLRGKEPDILLVANDVLFIPGSMTKTAALRAVEAGIQISTGLLIWRR